MAEAIYRYGPVSEIHEDALVALVSGQVEVTGNRIQICTVMFPAAIGDRVSFATSGVWEIAKTDADAWLLGALLYWDPATNKITDVAGSLESCGIAVDAQSATTNPTALVDVNAAVASLADL